MKRQLIHLLMLPSVAFITGCEKPALDPNNLADNRLSSNIIASPIPSDEVDISNSREWFQSQIDNPTVLDVVVANTKPLRWDWASVQTSMRVIVIPEEDQYTRPIYASDMSSNGFRDVIIHRDTHTGEYQANLLEVRPDADYLSQKISSNPNVSPQNIRGQINMSDFTGYLLYYEGKNGALVYAMKLERGVHVSNLEIPGMSNETPPIYYPPTTSDM